MSPCAASDMRVVALKSAAADFTTAAVTIPVNGSAGVDLGVVGRALGLEPSTIRLNDHFISRGADFVSQLLWNSLLSFFAARGLPAGGSLLDSIVVQGKSIANTGWHSSSGIDHADHKGFKRKIAITDENSCKKNRLLEGYSKEQNIGTKQLGGDRCLCIKRQLKLNDDYPSKKGKIGECSSAIVTNMNESYFITFKFGGYWTNVQQQSRKKYKGGNQRTVKLAKDVMCYFMLRDEIEVICSWLKGHNFELHYHISGTLPKEYKLITSDVDVMEMIEHYNGSNRAEVVVAMQEDKEYVACSQNIEIGDHSHMLELYHSTSDSAENNDIVLDTVNDGFLICQSGEGLGLSIGSRFQDSQSFKQMLRTEAILNNFAIKIKASDKKRVIATCSHRGCPWRIRASLCVDGHTFEVRKLNATHICPGVNMVGNKQATSSWVAHQIQDIVKKNPDIPPKHINNNLEATYGLSLPYMKVWRSREQARDIIFGSIEDNYKWVPTLKSELINRNPGSHITYTYDIIDKSFQKFYVSFKVCSDGFVAGCRPLIGVDSCHLKPKHLGVLLSANSLDGNNGLFTIAFAVVESESNESWQWFLQNLAETLGCEIEHLAFISDMEKGLGEAIRNIFPNAEHRVCMRHLWKNMKKYFRCNDGQKVQSVVWAAANAYTKHEFDAKLVELLHISPQIHSYLLSLPYKWSRHQFSTHIKNHYNTNMSESFNAWIEEAIAKPVVDLIDMIRSMIMEQRAQRKLNSIDWGGELVPYAEEYIREITSRKDQFIIRQSTPQKAEVEGKCERHEVNTHNRECSCRFWQITGLPCIHVVAFIGTKQHPLWHTYVDDHYHIIRYKMAYEGAISTLPSKDQWQVVNDGVEIGVPNTFRPRGRPKEEKIEIFFWK